MATQVHVIDVLSETLLEDKGLGDGETVLDFDHMTIIVAKHHGREMSSLDIITEHGMMQFPEVVFVDIVPDCVESRVLPFGITLSN